MPHVSNIEDDDLDVFEWEAVKAAADCECVDEHSQSCWDAYEESRS